MAKNIVVDNSIVDSIRRRNDLYNQYECTRWD